MDRREFLAATSLAGMQSAAKDKTVRVGVIGTGGRGTSLLGTLLGIAGVRVPALCDIDAANLERAQALTVKAGHPQPEGYGSSPEAYKRLLGRDDLDAVVIATPWDWHARMAVDAMNAGKYTAVEVPCALALDECWDLVETAERTGKPCMMLENWSFRRDNLAVLNMIRLGLLGETVHCHCAHSHDCVDHWFFDRKGNMRCGGEFMVKYNRDQYPTHSLGPVLSWMNINCGDAFDYITSTAAGQFGITNYFRKNFGEDHPNARREYRQGDIVTSVIRTKKGKTVVVNYDMQLPRPYDNRWMIQGTEGVYMEARNSVYLHKRSPKYHEWEPFPPYQDKYDHKWWKPEASGGQAADQIARGHGGADGLELSLFLEAVRTQTLPPLDVYDSVTMSAVIALSGLSIERNSAPVPFPDFTRGKWTSRKPYFALDMGD